jgi:NhaA family Na+:H+ antiporter
VGGVLGPIAVFFALLSLLHASGAFPPERSFAELARGWGIPTATDIALAWLVARAVFGAGHPAINFLLLLAVADDGIGLAIIALFYGDPAHRLAPLWLLLVLLAMGLAALLRARGVRSWQAYVFTAGPVAWSGLMLANLHPALALVFVVPFLPGRAATRGSSPRRTRSTPRRAARRARPRPSTRRCTASSARSSCPSTSACSSSPTPTPAWPSRRAGP